MASATTSITASEPTSSRVAAKPHTREHTREEPRGTYRAQSIRAIQEVNGDVAAFLQELDAKRRQLDDQIHRYVKQKDRDFQLFEREARIRHRSAGAARSGLPFKTQAPHAIDIEHDVTDDSGPLQDPDTALLELQRRRKEDSGLVDRRVAHEREVHLHGLFTPTYLPMLRPPGAAATEESPSTSAPAISAPIQHMQRAPRPSHHLVRANSDPVSDKQSPKHVRIRLEKRTSSSGSESKRLVSALKSTEAAARLPRRKRVSLVVGDEVVAPTDNINALSPDIEEYETRTSFVPADMEQEPRRDSTPSPVAVAKDTIRILPLSGMSSAPAPKKGVLKSAMSSKRQTSTESLASQPSPHQMPEIDDFFEFEDTEFAPRTTRHDPDPDQDSAEPSPGFVTAYPDDQVEREDELFGTTPVIPIMRRSSGSSSIISPAHARSSVKDGSAINTTELDAAPEIEFNDRFGSYAASYSFMPGSLGESYMERNAQELRQSGRVRRSSGTGSSKGN